ncbi:MAG: TonB-dependent hemoglobin/transferrin/lactoferrin family receptor [Xanthomonadales bacterium]|nr:TonB-dependent hemoglobin/transferrin/lactoferrin family receptor [Xanthomonadales bacterium]
MLFFLGINLIATSAMALQGEAAETPIELEPVVVVATKISRPVSEVAGQVSVIDRDDIRQHLVEDLDDLLRYEPGLNAETDGTRFGLAGFNIRGIGGNRVAVEVDGVPLRDRFAIGSYSNGGQELLETERIKRLEILHGPASSLYGSDALGGVLAFTTLDPDDLLTRGDGRHWYGFRGGYRDEDQSWAATVNGAWASGAHALMLSSTRREGSERDNNSAGVVVTDPQDWASRNHSLRYTWDTKDGSRLRFSLEEFKRESQTEIRSILGFARFRNTSALSGDDQDDTTRFLLDYDFAPAGWERMVVRAFSSDSHTRQLTLEERATGRSPSRYERYFDYRSRLDGFEFNAFRNVAWGASDHRIGAGVEWLRTRSEEFRDGFQQLFSDGSISRTILGETMPVRDFPNAAVTELGLFVQDEIGLGDWQLIPALRWDRFDVKAKPDAIYLEDYPDTDIVSVSDQELTPRLGVVRDLGSGWSAYGQYVRGFRAPPHEDANIGFDISVFKFRAIPNPNLKPEQSKGFEAGFRRFTAHGSFSLALFETQYTDFIESRVPVGTDPLSGYLLFQSRNIDRARIRGADLRWQQALGPWRPSFEGLTLNAAVFWSEGEDLSSGQPLNSVSPPQAILGLGWRSRDQRYSASLTGTFTHRQDRIDDRAGARFETPGYSLFDLGAAWHIKPGLDLRLAVRNLGDRQYWRWADVSNFAPDDPTLQLLSRPGRSFSMSFAFGF